MLLFQWCWHLGIVSSQPFGTRWGWDVLSNPGLLAESFVKVCQPGSGPLVRPTPPLHPICQGGTLEWSPWQIPVKSPLDSHPLPDLRDGVEWRGDLDCNRGWLRGFPRLPQYCGAACGLPPIGAILTSDGANPGLQGAGSVSGRRSSYTFMYCPYYPTATHSLPERSPGKRNCNHCESCWIRTSEL